MKAFLFYDSNTGNTKMLANEIKKHFEITSLEKNEVVFVGSWTDKGNPTEKVQSFLSELKDKKIFYFGTCGFGGSTAYFDSLFNSVVPYTNSSTTILGYFYCQGEMFR